LKIILNKLNCNYWAFWLSDFRTIGPSDYRIFGLLDFRTIGPSDYWAFGLSDLRTIGPSDYWADTGHRKIKWSTSLINCM